MFLICNPIFDYIKSNLEVKKEVNDFLITFKSFVNNYEKSVNPDCVEFLEKLIISHKICRADYVYRNSEDMELTDINGDSRLKMTAWNSFFTVRVKNLKNHEQIKLSENHVIYKNIDFLKDFIHFIITKQQEQALENQVKSQQDKELELNKSIGFEDSSVKKIKSIMKSL